jgi:hypothetical protein
LQRRIRHVILSFDKDNQQAVCHATRREVWLMTIFEGLYIMITFGMLIIAILSAKK